MRIREDIVAYSFFSLLAVGFLFVVANQPYFANEKPTQEIIIVSDSVGESDTREETTSTEAKDNNIYICCKVFSSEINEFGIVSIKFTIPNGNIVERKYKLNDFYKEIPDFPETDFNYVNVVVDGGNLDDLSTYRIVGAQWIQ